MQCADNKLLLSVKLRAARRDGGPYRQAEGRPYRQADGRPYRQADGRPYR